MKPIYSKKEYELAKSEDKLPCKCEQCNSIFYVQKKTIKYESKHPKRNRIRFCSYKCLGKYYSNQTNIKCSNCEIMFIGSNNIDKRSKTNNRFCSKSCAVTFNNNHKKFGIRRSKLEIWLEKQLPLLYPNMEFHFNRKDAINSELDIYIPSLKLAFELCGIFHYEPIYGTNKLSQVQNNDNRKYQSCIENGISLCIIDVSNLKYFKEDNAKKYLNIITGIISNNLLTS